MRGVIFFLLVLVTASLSVNAISVASDYLADDTLVLIVGTSKIYSIRLQNPTDYEASLKVDYDNTFMKVIDYKEIYTLAPKETGYRILFNITAPKKLGVYKASYTVSEVEPSGGGGLPIRLKINRNFNLKVIEDPNRMQINYFNLAFAVALISISIVIIAKKDKKKISKKVIDCLLKHKIISKRRKYRKVNK